MNFEFIVDLEDSPENVRNNSRFDKTRIIVATANPIRIDHLRDEADLV